MHVLRLCSVFEPIAAPADAGTGLDARTARFDPIGGMQNHTAALTRCLDEQGHRQTVLTSRLAGPRRSDRQGLGALVHRTGARTRRARQLWALAAVPRALRRTGTPVDVVHAHQGEDLATLLLGRLAARRHRCPLVVTVHCSVGHTLTAHSLHARVVRAVGGSIERRTLRRADAVVVLTARTAAALREDGVPADRISTIPSGFEPAVFERVPAGGRRDRPRIGYVGRLAAQKRADLLVSAFGAMQQEADLLVVGDGPERERVHRLVRTSPAADRITTTGFVEHSAVPGVLASLDLLVLPSAYEEMGSVLVEAMVAGLPVVASDVGGIPEVVVHGETGLLVPPGDVPALTAALDRLVADPALRSRLAEGARERSRHYSWPHLATRVADVYRRVRSGEPALPVAA
ncbi:glycosyltransferase family 4 protein [Modestobacter sp. SSW1-42]|uniref:glycosyltransferase family 4 protein n=1 Tax=Modestobacter sp. SSW1-42 TaxID=596372 RepID=UPI003985B6B4